MNCRCRDGNDEDQNEAIVRISPNVSASNSNAASCSSRRRSRRVPVSPERLLRMENRCLSVGGLMDQIANTGLDGHKPRATTAPFPVSSESPAQERFQNNSERLRRTPHPPRGAAGSSQSGNLPRSCQRFIKWYAFDLSGLDIGDAATGFRLPCRINRRFDPAMPCDQNAIHQLCDHHVRHLPGFFNYLFQCERHVTNLAQPEGFDNPQPEKKTPEIIVQKIFDELPVP